MRILLDECIPKRIRHEFAGHTVFTVAQKGWAGIKNGELLKRMLADGFEVFVTVDQSLRYQQNLPTVNIAVLVLIAPSNRAADLLPLIPGANAALATIQPGECVEIRQ
jgi:hypothetical protein